MSKSLSRLALGAASSAAGATAPAQPEVLSGPLLGLLAAGICVLFGWVFVRVLRPGKFLLRRVPARHNHLSLVHVAAMFLLYFASAPLAAQALARAQGLEPPMGKAPITVIIPATMFAQVLLIGAALTVAATAFRHGLGRGVGLSFRHGLCDSLRGLIGCIAVVPLCYAALMAAQAVIPKDQIHIHPVLEFVPAASALWLVAVLVSTVLLAPVAEELLYRGLLQSLVRQYTGRPWAAILTASAFFAASHYPQYQDMPALFILSVALGYNYARTGRLVAPMVLHGAFNAVMIWVRLAT